MDIIGGTITAHKIGDDHDNRYIKQDQLSTIVRTSGDQTITGTKNMNIVKVDRLELKDISDGATEGFIRSFYKDYIALTQKRNNSELEVFKITKQGYVDFPFDDVRSKGKKLASEEYVNSVVSSVSQLFTVVYADVAKYVNGQSEYPIYEDPGGDWHTMLRGWFYKNLGFSALKARMYINGDGAEVSTLKMIADDIDLTLGTDGTMGMFVSDAGETGLIEITMHPTLFSSLSVGYHEWQIKSRCTQSYNRNISQVLVYLV
jgi:hypothetical protein